MEEEEILEEEEEEEKGRMKIIVKMSNRSLIEQEGKGKENEDKKKRETKIISHKLIFIPK